MTDATRDILSRPWTAVPNDEIGGWAVSTDGRTPAAGGVTAADMLWSREVAEHIAALHNQALRRADTGVPVASGFITVSPPPPWWRRIGRRKP